MFSFDNGNADGVVPLSDDDVAWLFTQSLYLTIQTASHPAGEIRGQVQTAGPAGEGPDIFIGAGDWSGELASNGVAAAIDLGGRDSEFNQVALDGFSFDGSLYALPYATEAIPDPA